MAGFDNYLILYVYPMALFIFVLGSALAFRKRREWASFLLLLGFIMILSAHLLKNFGPRETTFTETGGAIIQFTFLFDVATYMGVVGILMASISFMFYVKKTNAT